jgi:hypothetical protein
MSHPIDPGDERTLPYIDSWTLVNFAVRPDPAARDNGLSKDESCLRRTGLRKWRFDRLSANGFFIVLSKFAKVH